MKSFDEVYSSRADLDNEDDDHNRNVGESTKKRLKYILTFVDEINRFVPKIHDTRIMNPVAEQIMRTVTVGGARDDFVLCTEVQKCNRLSIPGKYRTTYNS